MLAALRTKQVRTAYPACAKIAALQANASAYVCHLRRVDLWSHVEGILLRRRARHSGWRANALSHLLAGRACIAEQPSEAGMLAQELDLPSLDLVYRPMPM